MERVLLWKKLFGTPEHPDNLTELLDIYKNDAEILCGTLG